MTLGAFSTHLPTASMMLMRYADIDADRELDPTRRNGHDTTSPQQAASRSAPSTP